MSDGVDGFKPADEEPRFATAPEPDVIVPRVEPSEEPVRAAVEQTAVPATGEAQTAEPETAVEQMAAALGVAAEAVEVEDPEGRPVTAPITVKSDVRVRVKVKNADGTVTERVYRPKAARMMFVALAVGLLLMIGTFIMLVAILER